MNIEETSKMLGLIQVIDNRRVDEATILAWLPLVEDLEYAEAVEAVTMHRRESTGYLLPAHVRQNVARIRSASPFVEDEFGNLLPVDEVALYAQRKIAAARARSIREVTA